MAKQKIICKNEIIITLSVMLISSAISLLLYIYMGSPLKVKLSDYETIDSQSCIDRIEYKDGAITIEGWFFINNQVPSQQMKKEIFLSSTESEYAYSYPLQYISRPDVAKAFPQIFKDDKYKSARAGFVTQINTHFIKKGIYKISARFTYDNKTYISDLNREIKIK